MVASRVGRTVVASPYTLKQDWRSTRDSEKLDAVYTIMNPDFRFTHRDPAHSEQMVIKKQNTEISHALPIERVTGNSRNCKVLQTTHGENTRATSRSYLVYK